jgi:hypothetical protein
LKLAALALSVWSVLSLSRTFYFFCGIFRDFPGLSDRRAILLGDRELEEAGRSSLAAPKTESRKQIVS